MCVFVCWEGLVLKMSKPFDQIIILKMGGGVLTKMAQIFWEKSNNM